ncbi:archaea-specific SMC-related protein [Halorubellus salinus]|uniref:archaea-specific SMC-related protein n=1 Tax=Halorubellus salinus TaxID=755309 RepID=UPI001D090EAB|nr:archaea-specific SMC-related protein [Halorubellus salinus]
MKANVASGATARVSVSNVGGIDETAVDLPPGVTVLSGKNATNRTSFLQSIMAAMGSRRATLKGDADAGSVELDFDGVTATRTLERADGTVTYSGEPYLDDPTVADLFAFLLENNEARQAVARGDDLLDIIMRPVDVDELTREIERLEAEKADINDELADLDSRKREFPDLEARRDDLREEIADVEDALEAKEAEIDASNRNLEESREDQQRLQEKLEALSDTRSELESIRRDIDTKTESVSSLKQQRRELEAVLDELPDAPMDEHAALEDELAALREQKRRLNGEVSELQSVIQFNEDMLSEANDDLLAALAGDHTDAGDESVTDQLLGSESSNVACWTCGTTVDREQIESTLATLRETREAKMNDVSAVEEDLEEVQSARREAKRKQENREQARAKIDDIDAEIDRHQSAIESLQGERDELQAEIESLQAAVDDLESAEFGDVLALHREANELEFELQQLEADLESVTDEIETIAAELERADDLRERREELLDELTEVRTRIDRLEADAVEAFNEHMDAILDVLGYENLERIWIERLERTVREGREKVGRTVFELHVVRTTENGTAYEDTIDHLSESEREVTGLIFALAGYLVHDVHETVPFMLLDSLEAIDSDRIAALVEYFSAFPEYLVVALLPEDAQALDDDYSRVTEI